jgi:hypothetical protein
MRLPFLQMESDLLAHGAAEVAHLAGCSVPLAVGHIAMVRAWAVSMADDSAPPDGWIDGEAAGRRIEAAAQWAGERGRLLEALKDAGQVRTEQGGIRILHLEPYADAWARNLQSKRRMAKLRARSQNIGEHAGTDGERAATFDGQTQTQTQINSSATQEPAGAVPPPAGKPFALEEQPPPGSRRRKDRTPSPAEDLFRLLQRQREERCAEAGEPFVPERWDFARQNTALAPLLKGPEEDRSLFEGGWFAYLADDGERARKPAWSLAFFMSAGIRAKYETIAAREAAA